MIQDNEFFINFNDDITWSGIESTSFGNYSYDYEGGYEIPSELYIGMDNNQRYEEKTAEHKNSDSYDVPDSKLEISSVGGEKKYNTTTIKPQFTHARKDSSNTTATPRKNSSINYESLFTIVDDKNKYTIGNENDQLTIKNNSEIKNLSCILNDTRIDLNTFIDGMIKSCPSDIMIKKQRVYKAKNIKRKRKTKVQIRKLERELKSNPSWEKEDFKRLSKSLELTRDQVYKWFWDQKNKKYEYMRS